MKKIFKGEVNDSYEHKTPKPETVKANTWYTLTVSPEDVIHSKYTEYDDNEKDNRIMSMSSELHKLILKYQTVATCILHSEISKTGRLHFHGVIKMNDIWQTYFYFLPRLRAYGNIEIDSIRLISDDTECMEGDTDDMAKWWAYCTKMYHMWPVKINHYMDNIQVEIEVKGAKVKIKQTINKKYD